MPSPLPTYECAYRDPQSPLTPIPSLYTSHPFDFNSILLKCPENNKTPRTPFNTPVKAFDDDSLNTIFESNSILKVPESTLSSIHELKIANFKSPPILNNKLKIEKSSSPLIMDLNKEKQKLRGIFKFNHRNKPYLKTMKCESKILIQNNIATPTSHLDLTGGLERIFKKASPVRRKPLCAKTRKLLKSLNLEKYCKLFEKEEIDFTILDVITINDLVGLGVDKIDSKRILNAFKFC